MIPTQINTEFYKYCFPAQYPLFPPYFAYSSFGIPLQQANNDSPKDELTRQYNPKENNSISSEASVQINMPCKIEEVTEVKAILLTLYPASSHQEISKLTLSQKKKKNEVQKQGRNANSNLLRMFFRRFHQRLETEPNIIQKCISKNRLKIKPAKFMEWLELNDVEHRNYVRLPDMKELFVGGRGSRQQAKLMRILLKDFLQRQAMPCYLTSKKIKKETMPYNFHSVRHILTDITNIRS